MVFFKSHFCCLLYLMFLIRPADLLSLGLARLLKLSIAALIGEDSPPLGSIILISDDALGQQKNMKNEF